LSASIGYFEKLLKWISPYRGSVYKKIGGQKVINQLVDDFYFVMKTDPNVLHCLATHEGRSIEESATKLKAFLSGWTGGPQLYLEKYGHPRLRMRHFPFSIGEIEAKEWLYCMEVALKKSSIKNELQQDLLKAFQGLTDLIKNRS
jgi:hemoglobin